jgi:hypothetical protein
MNTKNRQLVIALAVYAAFTLLFLAANIVNYAGERDGTLEVMGARRRRRVPDQPQPDVPELRGDPGRRRSPVGVALSVDRRAGVRHVDRPKIRIRQGTLTVLPVRTGLEDVRIPRPAVDLTRARKIRTARRIPKKDPVRRS